jgi:hypothetical protein
MKWTGGEGLSGLTFRGTFDSSLQEYKGVFVAGVVAGDTGQLVKGVVSTFNGQTC